MQSKIFFALALLLAVVALADQPAAEKAKIAEAEGTTAEGRALKAYNKYSCSYCYYQHWWQPWCGKHCSKYSCQYCYYVQWWPWCKSHCGWHH